MSDLFVTKYDFFTFEKENEYLRITVNFVVSTGSGGMIKSMGGGGGVMVVACIFSASRIVVEPIKCEYTRILDNTLFIEDNEIWFLQMNCVVGSSLFV